MSIQVPERFAELTTLREGEAGREWLATLPALVDRLCQRWDLRVSGTVRHGGMGLVIPVAHQYQRYALKVSWPDAEFELQTRALVAWAGRGVVRLVDAQVADGACLLQWLDGGRSLADVGIDEALGAVCSLIRRMTIPALLGFPRLSELATVWPTQQLERSASLGGAVPDSVLMRVGELCAELGPSSAQLLVNRDLHYENVIADEVGSWVVIDPKPVIGDPEFALAPLLWRRFEEGGGQAGLDRRWRMLIDGAQLSEDRALGWALLYTVDYWLWGLEVGLTEDPVRCASIVEWLMSR